MRDGFLALYVDRIEATPDKRLSPNGRVHHMQRHEAAAAARHLARYYAADAMSRKNWARPLEGENEIALHWTIFWGKNERGRQELDKDIDNCISMLKAYQDGIFDALGVNDRRVVQVRVDQRRAEDGKGWMQVGVIALDQETES